MLTCYVTCYLFKIRKLVCIYHMQKVYCLILKTIWINELVNSIVVIKLWINRRLISVTATYAHCTCCKQIITVNYIYVFFRDSEECGRVTGWLVGVRTYRAARGSCCSLCAFKTWESRFSNGPYWSNRPGQTLDVCVEK